MMGRILLLRRRSRSSSRPPACFDAAQRWRSPVRGQLQTRTSTSEGNYVYLGPEFSEAEIEYVAGEWRGISRPAELLLSQRNSLPMARSLVGPGSYGGWPAGARNRSIRPIRAIRIQSHDYNEKIKLASVQAVRSSVLLERAVTTFVSDHPSPVMLLVN